MDDDDETWIREVVKKANTPRDILAVIVDNETFFGYDPYYRELRKAMLDQAEKVLSEQPPW